MFDVERRRVVPLPFPKMSMVRSFILAFLGFGSLSIAQDWKPLWDGMTFHGWHMIGKGEWKIEDGAIVGSHTKEEKEFGHLVTDAAYGDFTLRVKFKSVAGNSGVYFRIEEKGFSGVSGFQAEIDPQNDVGGLYETNGRAWMVKPKPEQVKTWFKPGEWNEMTILTRGAKLIVTMNGKTSAEIDDNQGRRQGRVALQVHGGQDCLVHFKDIKIDGDPISQ